MIAGKESDDCLGIRLHDLNECNDHSDRSAAVHRLGNDERALGVGKFVAVVPFVAGRNHEYLAIARKEWTETGACLTQQARLSDNRTELLRAIVPHDPNGQVSQAIPFAASQNYGPQMPD